MGNFVVSARKYRPVRFDEVVGQQHVTQTLKNALNKDNLAHAFLFTGPRGVGKTTCARILAKVINCEHTGKDMEPCNVCDSCVSFQSNSSFNIIELDAASHNSVDHMKSLVDQVRFQPQKGKYKVFIIDEVHMLTSSAFNAFLKTLEEPPAYAIFILATTEKHKILPTILSRCQIYDFKRIGTEDIATHLAEICKKEGIKADPDALHIIAQKSDGGLRDALSMFDRLVAFSDNELSYKVAVENLDILDYDYFFKATDAMLSENVQEVIRLFDQVLQRGFEGDQFMNGLSSHFRDLLMAKDPVTLYLLDVGEDLKKRYADQAKIVPESFILSAIEISNECDLNYKNAKNRRLHVELALIKMTFIQRAYQLEEKKNNIPELASKTPAQGQPRTQPFGNPESKVSESALTTNPAPAKPPVESPPISSLNNTGSQASESVLKKIPTTEELIASIQAKELQEQNAQKLEYNLENTIAIWEAWKDQIPQDSIKALLIGVKLDIQGNEIEVTVGSSLAESAIKAQPELMEEFRKKFSNRELNLNIKVEKSEISDKQKINKPLTNKEKFQSMVAANPLVEELQKKLELTFDDEY
jgi:DNA polymerase III subunit gamma/tau